MVGQTIVCQGPSVYLLTAHCIPKKDPVLMSLVYVRVGEGHEEKVKQGEKAENGVGTLF